MRILHVTDAYLPRTGGIEMHVHDLARAQVASGDKVDILTMTRGGDAPDAPDEVTILRPDGQMGIGDKAHFMLRRRAEGAAGGYDIVHVHCSTISPMSFLTLGTPGAARVMTLHSLWRGYKPVYRAADHVLHWSDWPVTWTAVSCAAAGDLRAAALRPIEVAILPNGIDGEAWADSPRLPIPHHLRIVAVMRLANRKRPIALLRILRSLRASVPDHVTLSAVILGDGRARPSMERFLARHGMAEWVSLTGHVPRAEIKREMEQADVFVAPAVLESFGIAALEARAAGLPVVGRTGTGLSDFIRDGEGGFLVGNDRKMVEVLAAMAISPELTFTPTTKNLDEYSWPTIVQRHREVYEIAGNRRFDSSGLGLPTYRAM